MLRILHTEWSDGWGGQERRVVNEIAGMIQRGHHVVLATRPQCRIAKEAAARGIPVFFVDMKSKFDFGSVFKLARYLRAEHIQIVNTHSGIDSWQGAFAAKLARVPVLVRTRHLNLPLKRSWHNFVHYMADQIISCGDSMKQFLIESCHFPESQITSIPTGVDFNTFKPNLDRSTVRQSLGIPDTAFVIAMVGIIRGVKRHTIALEAFQQILQKLPDARLLLAGEGPMRPDMERLAQTLGIADHVLFLGHREDVPNLMAASDVLLLTSRSEGVPQAVTQALGLGIPVVATQVGGVPELVQHEKTGLLVPAEDSPAAAAALMRIAENHAWAQQLGEQGRQHILAKFSLDAMLNQTEALFNRLLAEKKA